MMDDVNAKIGADNTGCEQVMGKHKQMNKNGEMFEDFCAERSLVIGGSLFPHEAVHKADVQCLMPHHITL